MYKIKTFNKVSKQGLAIFDDKYTVGDEVENPDGILVRAMSLHEEPLNDDLLCIARTGAGTNNIPIEECSKRGIVVCNTPGANANAVKELVVCALMLASRKIIPSIDWVRTLKGQPEIEKQVEKGKGAFVGPEIKGKKIGVIGLGAVGGLVANAANHLGMKVYGYDPYMSLSSAWNLTYNAVHIYDIKEIFKECDYITVHVPLDDTTRDMINKDSIRMMKDGVRILNFARKEVVNVHDIKEALEEGKVATFITDFPCEEIIGTTGVVATPHLGGSTIEAEDNCGEMAVKQLIDYIENGNIVNSVNLPEIHMPRSGKHRICIIHKNQPKMLTSITSIVAENDVNIENMLNKSKDSLAYTMLDVNDIDVDIIKEKLYEIEGVIRVRII